MSGHGVVSKHSAAASAVADVVAGPIQKWIQREKREREKETMVTSAMRDKRTHAHTWEEADIMSSLTWQGLNSISTD